MLYETCSETRHFFNSMFVGKTWDRYCDCKKKRMTKKKYNTFLKELEAKINKPEFDK